MDLASAEITLFSVEGRDSSLPSTSYLFSVPLPLDTPQCIHTSYSALEHTLTATLHPIDPTAASVSSTVVVHIRRYASHPDVLQILPETQKLQEPTTVEVQVPRTTFRVGEPIPLYITIPPPRRELVLQEGLRLRNIRAELVRVVRIRQREDNAKTYEDGQAVSDPSSSAPVQKPNDPSTSYALDLRQYIGTPGGGEVVALSGTSCRLHPTRPLQIRLVLHPREEDSPHNAEDTPGDQPGAEAVHELNSSCTSISQSTILHDVSFSIVVHVTFMNMSSHTERIHTITMPVVILPPTAPLPEVEDSLETAYHKKHDRPPARTIREDDSDVPMYPEGEPGPSYSAAPPPFEEPDAPPPFFHDSAASGSRLPTFQESETEIYVPAEQDDNPPPAITLPLEGEGLLFGFPPSQQFDGYQEQERSMTPPPSMEMATLDPNVTNLVTLDETSALNALGLALEQHQDASSENAAPPPPPPMDDPSDPPPSIDSAFRSPNSHHISTSLLHTSSTTVPQDTVTPDSATSPGGSHEHAPPPYGGPDNHSSQHDEAHVTRPPPYVDLVPARQSGSNR